MRASKKARTETSGCDNVGKEAGIHISGAEGIFDASEISKIGKILIDRALSHSRGNPDKIVITLEKITRNPSRASLLPLRTLKCSSPEDAWSLIDARLSELGVSPRALRAALRVLRSEKTMRGAALVTAQSGRRMEPDRTRGVRVSHLGIDKASENTLSRKLSGLHINNPTVKEALILASKVASCKDIVAEVCFSDDPDYTTGYLASLPLGYLRVPNVKRRGEMHGGRVFFVKEESSIEKIIVWLERKPVIIGYSHD